MLADENLVRAEASGLWVRVCAARLLALHAALTPVATCAGLSLRVAAVPGQVRR